MTLDEKLYDFRYWEKAFERLNNKTYLTKIEREELYYYKENYTKIIQSILDNSYVLSTPEYRELKKPNGKKRVVYVFSLKDRYVIGAVTRCLNDYFSYKISKNCFSYKTGISTIDAIKYLKDNYDITNKTCVKIDISKYFNSVPSEHLQRCIDNLFSDVEKTCVENFVRDIYSIRTTIYQGVEQEEYMGLIPGSAISTFFGNWCLTELDLMFKDKPYARYADDILLFEDSSEELESSLNNIIDYLTKVGLSINKEKNEYFEIGSNITFLGLSFNDKEVDISQENFKKVKAKIKHQCKIGRKRVEMEGEHPKKVIADILKKFNRRMYKCYIVDKSKYGWGYYAFRYITTNKTLIALDHYLKDRLRYVYTGKNNKSNFYKCTEDDLKKLGYVSTSMMYGLFKTDFDAYCTYVDLMED